MISQTLSIRGSSNQLMWEQECGRNSARFWAEFCKILPSQNSIFINLQSWGILDLPHFSIVNATALVVNSYTVLYMCMLVIISQSDSFPEG